METSHQVTLDPNYLTSLIDSFSGSNGDKPHTDADHDLQNMLIDWSEFWELDLDDADWIAEPIIPAKRSTALFAPGGTGKSLLALYIAVNLAIGRDPFNGHQTTPTRILYLDYEMTLNDLAERLEHQGHGPNTDLTHLNYALLPSLPGLDQPEGGKAVLRLAELCDAELVIIDTFGRAIHGDENDADTIRSWYRWTGLHLKQAGRAFLRIDHAGKDLAKGQRGSSAKQDDVDVVWRMTAKESGVFNLHATKRRMGWVPTDVNITLEQEDILSFQMVEDDQVWPAGTLDLAATLDELGIDPHMSARKVSRALRDAERGARDMLVRAAVKYRQMRSTTFHFIDDETVDKPVDKVGTRCPDAPPEKTARTHPPDAPSDETVKPQVDDLGRASGTRPDAPPGVTVGRGASLLEGRTRSHPTSDTPNHDPI